MKKFLSNIVHGLNDKNTKDDSDRGDLVQTVIIIAGLSLVTISIVGWISAPLFVNGAITATCINDYNKGLFKQSNNDCYNRDYFDDAEILTAEMIAQDPAYQGRFCQKRTSVELHGGMGSTGIGRCTAWGDIDY